jgi:hypothetical protein
VKMLRVLLLCEAATFVVAASIHFGAFLDGYGHRKAGTAETVIAVALVTGVVLSLVVPPRPAIIGAQVFATLGVCVGLFTIAVGVGPRTVLDVAYHAVILTVLFAGLAIATRRAA